MYLAPLLLTAILLSSPSSSARLFGASDDPPPHPALEEPEDADGDGFPAKGDGTLDCDDSDPDVYPGAPEMSADGVDQDCDGFEHCYADEDGDGYGTKVTALADLGCTEPGASSSHKDCNDHDPEISPAGREYPADGVDSDCSGGELCYWDEDEDGIGGLSLQGSMDMFCDDERESAVNTDCDDLDPTISPSAPEQCNERDDDCDDLIDEDLDCELDSKDPEACSCGRGPGGGGALLPLAALLALARRRRPS